MNKFRYTLRDIARCSDQLEDAGDVTGFFSEAILPLTGFGISLVDNIVVLTTEHPSALTALAGMSYTVNSACALLDLVTQGLVTINKRTGDNDVIKYYLTYQCGYGNCGAFDYHGSYVQIILDALVEVEMEYTREVPPYKE